MPSSDLPTGELALAVDIGGTFTDLVLMDRSTGSTWLHKTPTTPDPLDGLLVGMASVIADAGRAREEIASLRFGTTAAVNTLLTRQGARVGFLVTEGFREVLHLARSQTPGPLVGWLNMDVPEPLAALDRTREVRERIRATGEIESPLDEDALRDAVHELAVEGVEVIAVTFIHSYANPVHERRAAEIVAEVAPGVPAALSSDVLPEYREYDRAVTTVANAYVLPTLAKHVRDLERRLEEDGWCCITSIVRSDGGVMSTRAATERPIATVFSGPSGGVSGALASAGRSGIGNILTLDMGGTSADVAVCLDGAVTISAETHVGDLPLRSPSVGVRSIGAGGGSIAWVPEMFRSLRVGPASAGALPGPACYNRGGTAPTVTDANVMLRRLPLSRLGGEIDLDRDAAEAAITGLAEQLNLDPIKAAQGIVDVVNENMAGALRLVSVERGLDPRGFALVAFGGAGPLHANALAERLGCYPVVIPAMPGVLSAYGFHVAAHRNTLTRTTIRRLDDAHVGEIRQAVDALRRASLEWLRREGVADPSLRVSFDMRFLRQGYELEIEWPLERMKDDFCELLGTRFRDLHGTLYGFVPDAEIEIVTVRVDASGASYVHAAEGAVTAHGDGSQAIVELSEAYFGDEWQPVTLYDRGLFRAGDALDGPGIILQPDTTTLVLPGNRLTIDGHLNMLIDERSS